MSYFSAFWYKNYKDLRNCCMTQPLKQDPAIREALDIPADLQRKQIVDLIDTNWMREKKLKWFGWDVNGWYAWTDSQGMIYRLRDLKRNDAGKKFEKEVTKIIINSEPRNDISATAKQLYEHELNLSKDCALCPKNMPVTDDEDADSNTSLGGGGDEEDEPKIKNPINSDTWKEMAGGKIPDFSGGYANGGIAETFMPGAADGSEIVYTDHITDASGVAPQYQDGKQKAGISTNAKSSKKESPTDTKNVTKSVVKPYNWGENKPKDNENPAAVGTYRVTPTDNTNNQNPHKKEDPYQNSYGQRIYTLDEFVNENKDKSYITLLTELPPATGLPGGPKMRYVRNPKDGKVMDMRHVMIVGFLTGNAGGLALEVAQAVAGLFGSSIGISAFDKQDFYSNNIGAKFHSSLKSKINGKSNYDMNKNWVNDFNIFIRK